MTFSTYQIFLSETPFPAAWLRFISQDIEVPSKNQHGYDLTSTLNMHPAYLTKKIIIQSGKHISYTCYTSLITVINQQIK